MVNHTTKTIQFSVELAGLPEETNGEDLEHLVVEAFRATEVKVKKLNFHATHRLANTKSVIAKLFNRRDTPKLLRDKKKSGELNHNKNKLKSTKKHM